tara:strand:+ start:2572 stop:3750 length:1179 start_codon:yes stop_codon:yes gene_type:complete
MNNSIKKPQHGFNISEFHMRLNQTHQMMSEKKLDALLITSPHNFRYFTGFDSYFWESPTRPWFLIIPANKEPIAAIPSIGNSALKKTWIKNIHSWPSPNPKDEGISLLASLIKNLNNKFGNIGVEIGNESNLRMPIRDYMSLQKQINEFSFVDGSNVLWNLRMIKSENEISKLKFICKTASEAYENLPNTININETERSICNKLKIDLISKGADHVLFMACSSGNIGYEQIIFDPTDNLMESGKILFIDTGATFDGYFCDFDRNFAFGSINEKVQNAYKATWDAVSTGIIEAVPGKKCSDIFKSMNKILKQAGSIGNGVGRMGHGFGLQLTEPPSIMINDDTILKPGMAITIEPVFEFETGNMIVQEENIIITENGNEIITNRSSKEIPLIK